MVPSRTLAGRSLAFVARKALRVLHLERPGLRARAVERRVVAAAEPAILPPPVTLPGQLERATGTFSGSLEQAKQFATFTQGEHDATVMHRVDDVVLDRGCLYRGLTAEHLSSLGRPAAKGLAHAESLVLCSTASGARFFGDWLLSDTLLELLAEAQDLTPLNVAPHMRYPHLPPLRALLDLRTPFTEAVHVGSLWLVDDVGYNESKRRRLCELRARVRRKVAATRPGRLVYLGRGAGYHAGRLLANEAEVVARLERMGFEAIDPLEHGPVELLERMLDCAVVVGVEGSHLSYAFLALREGGLMLTLQPPHRFQSSFRPRCVSAGIDWGFLVGLPDRAGFRIEPDEVEELLSAHRASRGAPRHAARPAAER
jgi:hypothetical protein